MILIWRALSSLIWKALNFWGFKKLWSPTSENFWKVKMSKWRSGWRVQFGLNQWSHFPCLKASCLHSLALSSTDCLSFPNQIVTHCSVHTEPTKFRARTTYSRYRVLVEAVDQGRSLPVYCRRPMKLWTGWWIEQTNGVVNREVPTDCHQFGVSV